LYIIYSQENTFGKYKIYICIMKKRLVNIFSYYDTEPMEILIGIIWLIILPVIWCFEFSCNLFIIIPSILLGLAMVKATCSHPIKVRKTLSYASFIFSIFVLLAFVFRDTMVNPSHWLWFLPLIISFLNLTSMTSKYYRKQKKRSNDII
jgi:hypothetical protein